MPLIIARVAVVAPVATVSSETEERGAGGEKATRALEARRGGAVDRVQKLLTTWPPRVQNGRLKPPKTPSGGDLCGF